MDREQFERRVAKAVAALPERFISKLENIDVVVADWPTVTQLTSVGLKRSQTILGLYEGIPRTKRTRHYGLVLPDKITIFQKPIEEKCQYDTEVTAEIQRVVKHEIAHHFGISDSRLKQIENSAG